MAVELATAYVALTVETSRIAREITKGFDPVERIADQAGRKAGSRFKSGAGKTLAGLGSMFGGALAAVGIKDFVGDALAEARESQKVGALTAQVIKTTGGAAKITTAEVGALAEAISNKTGKDDELVQTGANLLLTFKNVRNEAGRNNDIFNQATAAAVDLSAAGFGSVDGAAKMLGKALNDPIKGISALGRAGVTFTAAQKEQIKTMVESGDTLGAQKIIMQELQSQVGGAAEATATAGEKARVTFDNLKESAGAKLLPMVDSLALKFNDLVAEFKAGQGTGGQIRTVFEGIGSALGWLGEHMTLVKVSVGALVGGMLAWKAATIGINAVNAVQLGLLKAQTVGTVQHAIVSKTVTAATKVWAAGQWLLNAALTANPIGLVIAAIVGLIAIVVLAYKKNETFRAIIQKVWTGIKTAISSVVTWFRNTAWPWMRDAMAWIGSKASWLWNNSISPAFRGIKSIVNSVVTWTRDTAWPAMKRAFDGIGAAAKWVWTKVLSPTFSAIKTGVGAVKTAFETSKRGIKTAWDALEGIAKKPVKFVIQTVLNKGLIGGFNWLSDKIGGPHVNPIPLPRGFKTGGVLPGYTPGRDVHRFFSPTGGILDLSGGEGILRPEITRSLGGERGIKALNSGKVQLPYQAHAGGGVIDWIKKKGTDAFKWVGDKASAVWKAMKDPGKFLRDRLPKIPGSDLLAEFAAGAKGKLVSLATSKIKDLFKVFKGGYDKVEATGIGSNARGWQQLWSIVKGLVPGIQLTSAFRPGSITASGNRSMHSMGRAIDVAPPSMAAFNKIRGAFPNASELIYSPAGLRQLKNARPYVYGEPVRSMHYDHIHLAMKKGGVIPAPVFDSGGTLRPGLNVVDNRTGGPEHLVPIDKAGVTVYMTVSVDDLAKMTKVGDFLDMLDNARVNGRKTARSGRVAG